MKIELLDGFCIKNCGKHWRPFLKKKSNQKKGKKKQRNLPKIMLGTSPKIKGRSYMLYQRKREHASLLVQLAQLNVGLSSYPFTCQ